jgi:hypothetical protein
MNNYYKVILASVIFFVHIFAHFPIAEDKVHLREHEHNGQQVLADEKVAGAAAVAEAQENVERVVDGADDSEH